MIDEVEQAVVRPVQVLEDENQRVLLGERFEETSPRGKRLRLSTTPAVLLRGPAHERPEVAFDPLAVRGAVERFRDDLGELLVNLSALSVSRMPAWALMISLSAQYVTASPYGNTGPAAST